MCPNPQNFVERHSFPIVSGEAPETMRKLCLSANFHTRKLGEITTFYALSLGNSMKNANINLHKMYLHKICKFTETVYILSTKLFLNWKKYSPLVLP